MKNRILRTTLVVLAVAAQVAAGFFVAGAEGQKAAARARLASLFQAAGRAQALIGEIRTAEAGLAATGQDTTEWSARLAGLLGRIDEPLAALAGGARSAEAAEDLSAAAAAVAASKKLAAHAGDLLASEQAFTASSILFGDAASQLGTASGAITAACLAEGQAVELAASRIVLNEGFAIGGAAAWTLLVLLILLPRAIVPQEPGIAVQPGPLGLIDRPMTGLAPATAGGFDLDLAPGNPVVTAPPGEEPPHESERQIEERTTSESGMRLNMDQPVDLTGTARLCADLARIRDAGEIGGLLARAAELLDASGIVMWVVEAGGESLRPVASHGYSEHALARMRTLSGRADNAVSLAFREGRMQIVRGGRDRPGAVVAPIVTADGCVGAMAAEVEHGAEASRSVQAVSAIVAAQLASLVSPATTTTAT
jgi:hypothetical protein